MHGLDFNIEHKSLNRIFVFSVPAAISGSMYHHDLERPVKFFPEAGLLTWDEASVYCNKEAGGQIFNWYYVGDSTYPPTAEEKTYWRGTIRGTVTS